MPRGDAIRRGLTQRIRTANKRLTVHYPPARPPVGAPPLNPLGGNDPITTLAPTPSRPPVTIPCEWFDAMNNTQLRLPYEDANRRQVAWVQGATAMARVLMEDAALDPTKPYDTTVFTGAQYVEFEGERWDVVQTTPASSGFTPVLTYFVWLRTASAL